MIHASNGACNGCHAKLFHYGEPHPLILSYFTTTQKSNPSFHIAVAGRNEADQEAAFRAKKTRAHFGQSPHNYIPLLAIDVFILQPNGQPSFNVDKLRAIIVPSLEAFPEIEYSGNWPIIHGFQEYDHLEVRAWQTIIKNTQTALVQSA